MQPEIERGNVLIERTKDGWILCQIGRARYVKKFNLRDSEARQLIEQLSALLASQ
jgi:hypothetical protein